jgi:hypothetical protein
MLEKWGVPKISAHLEKVRRGAYFWEFLAPRVLLDIKH